MLSHIHLWVGLGQDPHACLPGGQKAQDTSQEPQAAQQAVPKTTQLHGTDASCPVHCPLWPEARRALPP